MKTKLKSIFKLNRKIFAKQALIISVFLFANINLLAQVTIGTGTSSQAHPYNALYGYGRSASIYTSTEIGSYGVITNLAWYVATAQSTSIPVKIYVKETSSTTLSANTWANMISGATLVYDASVSFSATGWKTIDINDFTYSSNNLLVLCEANYGGGGTVSYPVFRYTSNANKHMAFTQDNTPPTGNGTVNGNRPNIQITITNCSIVGGSSSPASGTINAGDATTITCTGHTSSGTTLQWEQSTDGTTGWTNVTGGSGETTSVCTTPALTSSVYYRLKVTDSGNPTCVKYSTVSCVTVVCPLSGGTALATDDEIFKGQSAELTCSGYTSSGTSLQWQWSADGLTNWADVSDGSGATTSAYTSGTLTANTYFRLKVIGASCTTYSTVEQVNVICRVTSGGTAIATDTDILMGETVTISVSDYSAGSMYFQWEQSANGTSGWTEVSGGTGAYTDTYNTPELWIKTYYRLMVSDDYCAAYSSVVEILTSISNDECAGAVPVDVNEACNYQTYNNTGATVSSGIPAPGCGGTVFKDIWFKLVVPSSGHIEIGTQSGTLNDVAMALYSGTCASLSLIECDDDTYAAMPVINRSGLTPGDTLYLRVWDYNGNDFGTFGLCIYVPAPIAPDECVNATELSVGPVCEYYVFDYSGSTESAGVADPTCGISNYYNDVWFKCIVPPSGNVRISTLSIAGSNVTDVAIAVYSGDCASLTQVSCEKSYADEFMPLLDVYDRTPGEWLYIRFWDEVTSGKSTGFDQGNCKICVYELPDLLDCIAAVSPEDLCADAPIIMSLDGYCGNTSATYNPESPGNLTSLFCGSIENNSWLTFIASEESAQLNVYVSDCYSTSNTWSYPTNGIQMQVYGTADCVAFSAYSDCWFPGVPVDGFITAQGLTPGNKYYLMIDGVYGDNCDYKIGAAEGSVILPVRFISNSANCVGDRVEISWTTGSEKNCDYFTIEKSYDAVNYFMIGQIPGSGTTYKKKSYSFDDYDLSDEQVYYRIKQTDYDGASMFSDVFTTNCFDYKHLGISVYPNPFKTSFSIKLSDTHLMPEKVEITSLTGEVILAREIYNNDSDELYFNVGDQFIPGYYLLKIYFGENISVLKLIKI